MDDVSAGVAPRGSFDEHAFRSLLDGIARVHARYWGQSAQQAELPILTLAGWFTSASLRRAALASARRAPTRIES
jgi:hypothetical protein